MCLPKGPFNVAFDDATMFTDSPTRTKLIEGLEDRLNRIESFVMSDLASESSDTKSGDRPIVTHNTYDRNGRTTAATCSYPARPWSTPAPAKEGSSRLANGTATPRSESSILSPSNVEEKSTDLLATDFKGQSQYIGRLLSQAPMVTSC